MPSEILSRHPSRSSTTENAACAVLFLNAFARLQIKSVVTAAFFLNAHTS